MLCTFVSHFLALIYFISLSVVRCRGFWYSSALHSPVFFPYRFLFPCLFLFCCLFSLYCTIFTPCSKGCYLICCYCSLFFCEDCRRCLDTLSYSETVETDTQCGEWMMFLTLTDFICVCVCTHANVCETLLTNLYSGSVTFMPTYELLLCHSAGFPCSFQPFKLPLLLSPTAPTPFLCLPSFLQFLPSVASASNSTDPILILSTMPALLCFSFSSSFL